MCVYDGYKCYGDVKGCYDSLETTYNSCKNMAQGSSSGGGYGASSSGGYNAHRNSSYTSQRGGRPLSPQQPPSMGLPPMLARGAAAAERTWTHGDSRSYRHPINEIPAFGAGRGGASNGATSKRALRADGRAA